MYIEPDKQLHLYLSGKAKNDISPKCDEDRVRVAITGFGFDFYRLERGITLVQW